MPPANTLEDTLAEQHTAVIVYYLDDSAVSKRLPLSCPELQRLWGRGIDLLPLTIDPLRVVSPPALPILPPTGEVIPRLS